MSNRNYPKIVTATTVIPFDNPVTAIPQKTITGATTFTKTTTGAQAGYCAIIRVVADGSNVPDLSAFKSIGMGTWDNTSGVVNQLWFVFDGTEYCVAITHPGTIVGGGGGDITPPSIVTVSVENAEPNKVLLAYGETLDSGSVPATSAYTVTINGATRTISAVAITGANVKVTFGGAAVVSTDTITLDYVVPGTGPIQDAAGNDAAALTGVVVGNNVTGSGTTLNAPTSVTLGTATDTTQPLTWTDTNTSPNENGYKVYRNTANNFSTATLATTTAANATSYTVTGLTASTLYYYWVVAAGNGTTTADSSPSTVASGSTGSSATLVDLTLSTNDGYTNTAQVFSVTAGGSSWGNRGLDPKKLASGTDGYIQTQYAASDQRGYLFGFDFTNALQTALGDGFDMGFYLEDATGTPGALNRMQAGGIASVSYTASVGDYIRIIRTGAVTKLQTSPDGSTWTDRYTYTNSTTADLFIVSDINGSGKLGHPKGYNVV